MKKKKYLPLYYEWMKVGKIPNTGLCFCIGNEEMDIFFSGLRGLWGYDGTDYLAFELNDHEYEIIAYSFTPLRQNMVLLLSAMNKEL